MVFGSPKSCLTKELTFGITPLGSSYLAPPGYTVTRSTITQDPCDEDTIAVKTDLRLGTEEYSATLFTEAASHSFFSIELKFDSRTPGHR